MSESLAVLEDQYFTLKRNLANLLDACKEDRQREELQAQYRAARGNYWKAQNQVLAANTPLVLEATASAGAAQKQMEQALEHLEDMTKTLDVIGGAVTAGTRLVTMLGL